MIQDGRANIARWEAELTALTRYEREAECDAITTDAYKDAEA
jgi:hypothetical protein